MSTRCKKFNAIQALSVLLLLAATGCREAVIHGLSEVQANKVKLELSAIGIEAQKERETEGWLLSVASENANRAIELLTTKRIVKSNEPIPPESSSLVRSKQERDQALQQQLSSELRRTLEALPGVIEARVHLHSDAAADFALEPSTARSSASVLLVTESRFNSDESAIQRLVSGATGVDAGTVSVVFSKIESLSAPTSELASEQTARSPAAATSFQQLLLLALGLVAVSALLFSTRRRARKLAQSQEQERQALGQLAKETQLSEAQAQAAYSAPKLAENEKLNGVHYFTQPKFNEREAF